jgi:hypothetical protein
MTLQELAERGIRVKPLEWEDQGTDASGGSYIWRDGLHYYVEGGNGDWYGGCMVGDSDVWAAHSFQTRQAAKAAAEADYAARVAAQIEEDKP